MVRRRASRHNNNDRRMTLSHRWFGCRRLNGDRNCSASFGATRKTQTSFLTVRSMRIYWFSAPTRDSHFPRCYCDRRTHQTRCLWWGEGGGELILIWGMLLEGRILTAHWQWWCGVYQDNWVVWGARNMNMLQGKRSFEFPCNFYRAPVHFTPGVLLGTKVR